MPRPFPGRALSRFWAAAKRPRLMSLTARVSCATGELGLAFNSRRANSTASFMRPSTAIRMKVRR